MLHESFSLERRRLLQFAEGPYARLLVTLALIDRQITLVQLQNDQVASGYDRLDAFGLPKDPSGRC